MLDEILKFLDMGGYAFYVWLAYGLFAFIFILNIVIPRWQYKTLVRSLQQKGKGGIVH